MEDNSKYLRAKKRVKEIKGFYIHTAVFLILNLLLMFLNFRNITHLAYWAYLTPLLWGIGLLAHGLSVILPYFIFGKNWEERKIRELMDKTKDKNFEP